MDPFEFRSPAEWSIWALVASSLAGASKTVDAKQAAAIGEQADRIVVEYRKRVPAPVIEEGDA